MKGSVKWDLRGMVYRISQTEQQLLLAFEKPWYRSDNYEFSYNNIIIQEDKDMYTKRVHQLFDEQHCVLSKNRKRLQSYVLTYAYARSTFVLHSNYNKWKHNHVLQKNRYTLNTSVPGKIF